MSGTGRRSVRGPAVVALLVVDSLVGGLFVPLSLLYLVAVSGSSLATVGTLLALAGVLSLPLPLWVGRVVDRIGAQPVVLAAQLVQAAGCAAYLVAVTAPLVFVAALIASLGQRLYWSSIFTLVSELSEGDPDPKARERWFGIIAALRAGGYGVGALVSGIVLATRSQAAYRAVVLAVTALLLLAAVVVAVGVPRGHHGREDEDGSGGYRRLWRDRPFLALTALNTVFALCNVMLGLAFPAYVVRSLPSVAWIIGPLLALNTVVQALAQTAVVRLIRPLPRQIALVIAGGAWALWSAVTACALVVPAGLRAPCLLVAVLCYAAAQLVHGPVSNAMAADAAPAELRGRYLAAFQYSFAVAVVFAPALFSLLTGVDAALPWVALAVLAALTVPAATLLARHLPPAALVGVTDR